MPLLLHVMASTRSTLKATRALNASGNLAVLFSSPARIVTYATNATPKKRTNMSVTDANKKLTGS